MQLSSFQVNEEQKELFYALKKRLHEAGINYLSDNNMLRYCRSYLWNTETAFIKLCEGEKWRQDNQCMEVYKHEILNEMNLKFAFIHGNDRAGRSLVWMRCRNYLPAKTNEVAISKFMTYALDRSQVRMKKHADMYIFILDLHNLGYSNFDIRQAKKIVPIISRNYAETLYAMIFIRGGFIFNAIYGAVSPFIHERTKAKFIFAKGENYLPTLLEKIDLDQIPKDYGGTGMYLDDTEL